MREAERVLWWVYKHGETGQEWIGCEEYSLYERVREHVDFVTSTPHFDATLKLRTEKRKLDGSEKRGVRPKSSSTLGSGEDVVEASKAVV